MEDAEILLRWKNDPVMRRYSLVGREVVSMADHLKWLKKNLRYITILRDMDNDIGDIRIRDNEMHIKLDKKWRGFGYGTEAVNRFKAKGMKTVVTANNIPSLRMFIRCGFLPVKYAVKNDIPYYELSL